LKKVNDSERCADTEIKALSEVRPCAFGAAAVLVRGKSDAEIFALCDRLEAYQAQRTPSA
jgi:hypothetical protein